jgi:molybdopterin-guanine dinucleotide biosynthesis protein A
MRTAAILAGGHASRYDGRDKGSLVVEGRTILERQIAELSRVPDVREILLTGARVPHAGTRAILDLVPNSGPLGGVHAALVASGGDAVFVVACDMPFVDARLVTRMFEWAHDADLVVPRTERGYHPLYAVYTTACLQPIARRLAARRLKLVELADEVRIRVVTAEELDGFGNHHRLLANVNTPADYAGLEALQGHER